jgi:hypothetical protein
VLCAHHAGLPFWHFTGAYISLIQLPDSCSDSGTDNAAGVFGQKIKRCACSLPLLPQWFTGGLMAV